MHTGGGLIPEQTHVYINAFVKNSDGSRALIPANTKIVTKFEVIYGGIYYADGGIVILNSSGNEITRQMVYANSKVVNWTYTPTADFYIRFDSGRHSESYGLGCSEDIYCQLIIYYLELGGEVIFGLPQS